MKRAVTTSLLLMILAFSAPAPAAAIDSFFDIFTELSVAGPPYPMGPLITIIGENIGGTFEPQQESTDEIAAVKLNGLPPGTPVIATLRGGGAGGSPPSIDSFFDVFFDIDFTTPEPGQMRVNRDIHIHPPGTPPGFQLELLPINPGAPPGTAASFFDIFVDDSFFDIHYRVADPGGYHDYNVHGVSPSGRMSFFDVFVELNDLTPNPGGAVDSFFDIFVDFAIGPGPCAPFRCNDPEDLCMVTNGSRVPNPVAVRSTTWSGIKSLLD